MKKKPSHNSFFINQDVVDIDLVSHLQERTRRFLDKRSQSLAHNKTFAADEGYSLLDSTDEDEPENVNQ